MNPSETFERSLAGWLTAEAAAPMPVDLHADAMTIATRRGQRRAWQASIHATLPHVDAIRRPALVVVVVVLIAVASSWAVVRSPTSIAPGGVGDSQQGASAGIVLTTCGNSIYPGHGIDAPILDLDAGGPDVDLLRSAFAHWADDLPAAAASYPWRIAGRDETGVLFLALTDDPEFLAWSDDPSTPGWLSISVETEGSGFGGSMGECHPRRAIAADLPPADWWLDPAFPRPVPDSTELHVLVRERQCASGRSPAGRMEEPEVVADGASVIVTIGIRVAMDELRTCPSNPALPVAVHLLGPLGDRTLLDGSYQPPRPPLAPERGIRLVSPPPTIVPTATMTGADDDPASCAWAMTLDAQERRGFPTPGPDLEGIDIATYVWEHPEAFGGVFVETTTGYLSVLVVAGQADADPERWVGLATNYRGLVIRCVAHPYRELLDLKDRIAAAIPILGSMGIEVVTVGPSERTNSVVVQVIDPDDRARTIIGAIAGLGAPLTIEAGEPWTFPVAPIEPSDP